MSRGPLDLLTRWESHGFGWAHLHVMMWTTEGDAGLILFLNFSTLVSVLHYYILKYEAFKVFFSVENSLIIFIICDYSSSLLYIINSLLLFF